MLGKEDVTRTMQCYVLHYSMIVCIGAALLGGVQLYYITLIYLSITSTYFMVSLIVTVLTHHLMFSFLRYSP